MISLKIATVEMSMKFVMITCLRFKTFSVNCKSIFLVGILSISSK